MAPTPARLLSKEESLAWLDAHGFREPYVDAFHWNNWMKTPNDTGAKLHFIKAIVNAVPAEGESLLFVSGHGIWNSENCELYLRLRLGFGLPGKQVYEAPGQIVPLSDRTSLECFLDVCFCNFWDALWADEARRFMVFFSHDEFVELASDEHGDRIEWFSSIMKHYST